MPSRVLTAKTRRKKKKMAPGEELLIPMAEAWRTKTTYGAHRLTATEKRVPTMNPLAVKGDLNGCGRVGVGAYPSSTVSVRPISLRCM